MKPVLILFGAELVLVALVAVGFLLYRAGVRKGAEAREVSLPGAAVRHEMILDAEVGTTGFVEAEPTRLRSVPDDDAEVVAEVESSWLKPLMSTVVIINTKDERSIRGLLVMESKKGVMLRRAFLLHETHAPVSLGGEIWIHREDVSFVQVPDRTDEEVA